MFIFNDVICMKLTINIWSFILSLTCIPVCFIAISSENFIGVFTRIIGTHPLNIVLGITLIAFVLGLIGLKDVREWKAMARSMFTIIFTMGFSVVLVFILFFGSLLN